jgi:CXXX repeat radical SAM target protein
MENNDIKHESISETSDSEESRMDRRGFFATAAKLAIPTIGIMGLTLTFFNRKAAAANCTGDTCGLVCEGFCEGKCSGTCKGTCEDSCFGGLKSFLPHGS